MIRVLHATTDTNIGGAGILLSHLLASESKGDIEYSVALPKESALIPLLEGTKARLLPLPIREKSFCLRDMLPFARALREVRPTVLHTHGALTSRLSAYLAPPVPYLVLSKHCVYQTRGSTLLRLTAHAAIATAPCASRLLQKSGMPPTRILTVANAVPPKKADSLPSVYDLGVPRHKRAVVFCGRLEAEKNPFFFLHLAKYLQNDPRFFFLMIGGGSMYGRLAAVSKRIPNLRVLGHLPSERLPPRDAYLLLNCSPVSETACLSLLEGFSLGIPALASDIEGNRELISPFGAGLLFSAHSVEACAMRLCRIAESDALYEGLRKGAKKAFEAHDLSRMCRQYERFYRTLSKGN